MKEINLSVTKDEFIKLYENHSYSELVEILGICRDRIRKYADMLGLKKNLGRRKSIMLFK